MRVPFSMWRKLFKFVFILKINVLILAADSLYYPTDVMQSRSRKKCGIDKVSAQSGRTRSPLQQSVPHFKLTTG